MNGNALAGVFGDFALPGDAGRASTQGFWVESGLEPAACWRAAFTESMLSCWLMLLLRGGNRVGMGPVVCGVGEMRVCACVVGEIMPCGCAWTPDNALGGIFIVWEDMRCSPGAGLPSDDGREANGESVPKGPVRESGGCWVCMCKGRAPDELLSPGDGSGEAGVWKGRGMGGGCWPVVKGGLAGDRGPMVRRGGMAGGSSGSSSYSLPQSSPS